MKPILLAILAFAIQWGGLLAADMNEYPRKCEAQIIAEQTALRNLAGDEMVKFWEEIISAAEDIGQIDAEHAKELRRHVEGVNTSPGYVEQVCK